MASLILHHYDFSPYSEKVRLAFGHKDLDWHSVDMPIQAPKPDLTPLTAGYRRAPVLQIGADVYCDTLLISTLPILTGLSWSRPSVTARSRRPR